MLKRVSSLVYRTQWFGSIGHYQFQKGGQYLFSSGDGGEPPKGFEKFKRKPKSELDGQNTNKEEDPASPKIQVDNQEKTTKEGDPNKTDQKKKDEQDSKPKDDDQEIDQKKDDKLKKKNYTFTFDPKIFNLNKGKNDKPKNDNEDQNEQQKEKDGQDPQSQQKKSEKKASFDFNKININDPNHRNILLALLGVGVTAFIFGTQDFDESISYTEFLRNYLDRDVVKNIIIQRDGTSQKITALIETTDQRTVKLVLGNVDHFLENLERIQVEKGRTNDQFISVEFRHGVDTNKLIDRTINVVYLGVSLVIAFTLFKSLKTTMQQFNKGGGGGNDIFGFGKSNVKQFGFEQQIKIKFKDVAGLDEAKNEIKEFVDFLKKPKKYKDIGAKLPRGALLSGPPGTGKTMLAKACAGEAGVPFFYVSGSDFVEMFVGVGASRVRDLFKQAKSKSPSIVFIDEIDAVGRKRESRLGGNDERDNTLNQLLVEMDGFATDHNVVVLAATNRKELLDPALSRPGRFDRTIDITLPDIEGRKQIFHVHLAPLKLDPSKTMDEYARRLATLTPGFSGAEIANLCNEGAILAARKNKVIVDSQDFELAAERVMAGLEKKKIISEEERKVVAYHESGHAVVSWFLEGGNPLLKLTIIPRSKGSLGYAQYLPNESSLETKEELLDRICCILGGRCSEQYFFKRITTGAYDDLKKAYETAHAIVTKFGMSESVGYVGYQESEFQKPYSDQTNKIIDDEIKAIIQQCTKICQELVEKHSKDIERLATNLLEKETLDLQKLVEILGDRPFPPKSNYKAYLEIKKIEQQEESKKDDEDTNLPKQDDGKNEKIAQN